MHLRKSISCEHEWWQVTSMMFYMGHGALFGHLWAHCDPFGLEWLRGKRHQEKRRRQKLPQRTWAGVVWDCACMISQMQVLSFLICRQHNDISYQFFFHLMTIRTIRSVLYVRYCTVYECILDYIWLYHILTSLASCHLGIQSALSGCKFKYFAAKELGCANCWLLCSLECWHWMALCVKTWTWLKAPTTLFQFPRALHHLMTSGNIGNHMYRIWLAHFRVATLTVPMMSPRSSHPFTC